MLSRCIETNITSARGTVHCQKTHIPFGDPLVFCAQYLRFISHELYDFYRHFLTFCACTCDWRQKQTAARKNPVLSEV
jgi:hypothetical protein